MDRKIGIIGILVLLALVLVLSGCQTEGEAKGGIPGKPAEKATQCGDHIDNDGDGYCDFAWKKAYCDDGSTVGDPGCTTKDDNQECEPSTEVCDGIDNDCDGSVDEGDVCGGVPI